TTAKGLRDGEIIRVGVRVGCEAIPSGACFHLRRKGEGLGPNELPDMTCGVYGRMIMGVPLKLALAEAAGRVDGPCQGKGGGMQLYSAEHGVMPGPGIIGAPVTLAVGLGMAAQRRKTGQVVLSFFGDGATNQGLFHEAMNFAGLQKPPVIFLCVNNQ